jgi:hypothetical protein
MHCFSYSKSRLPPFTCSSCASLNFIWVIKSRKMRLSGHVAHMRFWWGNLKEGDPLEDLDAGWMILVKWILKIRWEGMDWFHPVQDIEMAGSCDIKCREFLTSEKMLASYKRLSSKKIIVAVVVKCWYKSTELNDITKQVFF